LENKGGDRKKSNQNGSYKATLLLGKNNVAVPRLEGDLKSNL